MKIAINKCYGGFGLSDEACKMLKCDKYDYDDKRTDPELIRVVELLGEKADGSCANIRVIEIPDGIDYTIEEYDGMEWVAERHETWS